MDAFDDNINSPLPVCCPQSNRMFMEMTLSLAKIQRQTHEMGASNPIH